MKKTVEGRKQRPFIHSFAAAVALSLTGGPATAATITVEGNGTLADAITAANTDTAVGGCPAGSGEDVIELTGNVVSTNSGFLKQQITD